MTSLLGPAMLSLVLSVAPTHAVEYLVTAAPLTIGAPNGDVCVAIDVTDSQGVWWWEPGSSGCSTRSTGPGVFHAEGASVSTAQDSGVTDVQFRVRLITNPASAGRGAPVDVHLRLEGTSIRAMATGSKASIVRRKNLEVPGFDGVPEKTSSTQRALPAPVLTALTARFPQAKIDKWTREKEDGKEVYDIEFKQADRKFEADIFPDGTIHNWEQQIAPSDLPAAVTQTLSRKFPKSVIKEVMAVTTVTNGTDQLEGYEVVLKRTLSKDVEITIAPNGAVIAGH